MALAASGVVRTKRPRNVAGFMKTWKRDCIALVLSDGWSEPIVAEPQGKKIEKNRGEVQVALLCSLLVLSFLTLT
jgi:hypothetical protein